MLIIEQLAARFPLPIKYESRRKKIQRFLLLPYFTINAIWLPIIKGLIKIKVKPKERILVAIDRTQWSNRNLFVASWIKDKRAIPLFWVLLDRKGSSNLREQKKLLVPVLKMLKKYETIVIGDREFSSVELAKWLGEKGVYFCFRQKKNTYIKLVDRDYQRLDSLDLGASCNCYYSGIKVRKEKGFGPTNMVVYKKRKYRGKSPNEAWYLLTNLGSLQSAIKCYKARMGIEAMFKDCKTGGYNLEQSKAKEERFVSLVLLIAIAYTSAILQGEKIKRKGLQKYICRLSEARRVERRHSNFWVGLYGVCWVVGMEYLPELVEKLMRFSRNKLRFYQRGLRAMSKIQTAF